MNYFIIVFRYPVKVVAFKELVKMYDYLDAYQYADFEIYQIESSNDEIYSIISNDENTVLDLSKINFAKTLEEATSIYKYRSSIFKQETYYLKIPIIS